VITLIRPAAARMVFTGHPPIIRWSRRGQQQAYRQNKDAGLVAPRIRFNLFAVSDLLVEEGFLQQWDAEDKGKVRAALETALEVWSRYT
jgi:hypothetical protein